MKRKWDISNEAAQKKCLDEVIARVEDIDDPSAVGVIAAQDIIDIVVEHLAPELYNLGIRDAKKVIEEKLQDAAVDLDLLEQEA